MQWEEANNFVNEAFKQDIHVKKQYFQRKRQFIQRKKQDIEVFKRYSKAIGSTNKFVVCLLYKKKKLELQFVLEIKSCNGVFIFGNLFGCANSKQLSAIFSTFGT